MAIMERLHQYHTVIAVNPTFNNYSLKSSDRIFTDMRSMEVNILKATIHQD